MRRGEVKQLQIDCLCSAVGLITGEIRLLMANYHQHLQPESLFLPELELPMLGTDQRELCLPTSDNSISGLANLLEKNVSQQD